MSTTYRIPGAVFTEREHVVPLVHSDPQRGRSGVFTREVAAPDGGDRPDLVFFQGGPRLRGRAPHEPALRLDGARWSLRLGLGGDIRKGAQPCLHIEPSNADARDPATASQCQPFGSVGVAALSELKAPAPDAKLH